MKKIFVLCLSLLLCLSCFCACGGDTAEEAAPVSIDLAALSEELLPSGVFTDILSPVEKNIAALLYGVEEADIAECVANFSTGATAEELTVFKAVDAEAAGRLQAAAEARVGTQTDAYKEYAPAEVEKLENAIVRTVGDYVIYIVCADAAAANEILSGYGA